MINRMLLDYERDGPLIAVLNRILYFSEKELKVAELSSNGKSDNEIIEILKISPEHLDDIRKGIKERVKEILRGY